MDNTVHDRHEAAAKTVQNESTYFNWIDGQPSSASSEESISTLDPAISEPITAVPRSKQTDIELAVTAANEAAAGWSSHTPIERASIIREWISTLEEHREALGLIESLDTGKPKQFALDEVDTAIEYLHYYAGVAQGIQGEHLSQGPDTHAYVRKEPYGIAGLILPWNYPIDLFAWKAGAALAAGNTVVAKPSEEAPLSITRVAQLSQGILPDGVLNIVNGYGTEAGAALTSHEAIDKLSFTGSVNVGKTVMHAAAESVTPVTLELGGKSPFIVFEDADIRQAAKTAASGLFYNTGQSCDACSRILVQNSIHDAFIDEFISETENSWIPGDPLVPDTTMGPLAFSDQLNKVEEYIDIGQSEGANLLKGGGRPANEDLDDGLFIEPTIFSSVDNSSRIAQEEIFGPVQSIITFESDDEAIELANDVRYGLASGVATEDISTAHKAAADIDAGSVWINEYHGGGPGVPFGGFKESGFGRECAAETVEEYTHSKSVTIALD